MEFKTIAVVTWSSWHELRFCIVYCKLQRIIISQLILIALGKLSSSQKVIPNNWSVSVVRSRNQQRLQPTFQVIGQDKMVNLAWQSHQPGAILSLWWVPKMEVTSAKLRWHRPGQLNRRAVKLRGRPGRLFHFFDFR